MSEDIRGEMEEIIRESEVGEIPKEGMIRQLHSRFEGLSEERIEEYISKYADIDTNAFNDEYVVGISNNTQELTETMTDANNQVLAEGQSNDNEEFTGDEHLEAAMEKIQELDISIGEGTGKYFDGTQIVDADDWRAENNKADDVEPPGLEILEDVGHPLVPDMDHSYFKREVAGNRTDTEVTVRTMDDDDYATLLEGETSTGKDTLVKFICSVTNRPVIPVNFDADIEYGDVIGHYGPKEDGEGFEWKPGFLQICAEEGYVFLADEINGADGSVTMAFHGITEDGDQRRLDLREKGEIIFPHEEFIFVATQNPPKAAYGGANELNDAFQSRFYTIQIDYMEPRAESKVLAEKIRDHPHANLSEKEIQKVVKLADKLRSMYPAEIDTPIATRDLIKTCKMSSCMPLQDAAKMIIGGAVGELDEDSVNKTIETTL